MFSTLPMEKKKRGGGGKSPSNDVGVSVVLMSSAM